MQSTTVSSSAATLAVARPSLRSDVSPDKQKAPRSVRGQTAHRRGRPRRGWMVVVCSRAGMNQPGWAQESRESTSTQRHVQA
eukprot:5675878-Pleurochrysis_carterae.AAC.3